MDEYSPFPDTLLTKGEGDILVFQKKFKGWPGISDTAHLTRIIFLQKNHFQIVAVFK